MNEVGGSKTLALLRCPPFASAQWVREDRPEWDEGHAYHDYLEDLPRWMTPPDPDEADMLGAARQEALLRVPEKHRERCARIDLREIADYLEPTAYAREVSLAYHPASSTARRLGPGTRAECVARCRWAGDEQLELHCRPDMLGVAGATGLIADWKGARENESYRYQITTYALAAHRVLTAEGHALEEWRCTLLHLQEDGSTRQVEWTLTLEELEAHADALAAAWRAKEAARLERLRGGLPELSPGAWCHYCPAERGCPARSGPALALALGDLLAAGELTDELAGKAYELAGDGIRALEGVQAEIRERARSAPVPLSGGLVLSPASKVVSRDGLVARRVVAELEGTAAAAALQVDVTVTSAALAAVTAERYETPKERKAALRRLDDAIGEAGGLRWTNEVRARKPGKEEQP